MSDCRDYKEGQGPTIPGGADCGHHTSLGKCPRLSGEPCSGRIHAAGANTAKADDYVADPNLFTREQDRKEQEYRKQRAARALMEHGSTGEGLGHLSNAQAIRKAQGPI